jgi:hypothetical protein
MTSGVALTLQTSAAGGPINEDTTRVQRERGSGVGRVDGRVRTIAANGESVNAVTEPVRRIVEPVHSIAEPVDAGRGLVRIAIGKSIYAVVQSVESVTVYAIYVDHAVESVLTVGRSVGESIEFGESVESSARVADHAGWLRDARDGLSQSA